MFRSIRVRLSKWNRWRLRQRRNDTAKPHLLAVMAIMKNEALNLDEWVEHYLWQGAERIVLIDNGSTDTTVEVAQRWMETGRVSLISLPARHRQRQHYRTAFRHFRLRQTCRWLLIADLDEFWFCPDGRTIAQTLPDFDDFDVVYANWHLYGTSGHEAHPSSLRTGLTLRAPNLSHHLATKWLARTAVLRGRRAIDIHKVKGACSSKTLSVNAAFRINHYMTQSRMFWASVKMTRGDVLSS